MSAPRRLAPRLVALLVLGACVACAELGDAPAVRFGSRSFTVEDLRTAYADLDPSARPSLATREDRRSFVERLVERTLLFDEGERLLAADTVSAGEAAPERQSVLVRRLRTIEAGGAPIDSAAVVAAYERMRTAHHVEMSYFSREEDARAARDAGKAKRDAPAPDRLEAWITWSPFPDPVADAVIDLPLGATAGPLRVGGGWRLVRLRERRPHDPGPLDGLRARIFQGLRARREAEAVDALVGRLRGTAELRVNEAAVEFLATRTRDAILRGGSTEQDDAWAIPALAAGEETTHVATWRDGSVTMGDYVGVLRGEPRGQRPRVMVDAEVRRTVETEVNQRLLFTEAERRGLAADHWVRRALERSRHERALQRAIVEIERAARSAAGDSAADSLASHLHATQPDLFVRAPRARVLRFDFPTADAGRGEVERIRRDGGPDARLRAILDSDAPPAGPYHLLYVTPMDMPSREVVPRIFASGPGAVTGPHRQGDMWVVFACLELQAAAQPTRDEILAEFRTRLAETGDARRVDEWLRARKSEIGVHVDDEELDALAPGG